MLSASRTVKRKRIPDRVTQTCNKFEAFESDMSDDDDDDDEESIMRSLNAMSSHVELAGCKAKPQRIKKYKRHDLAYLNSVARKVKSGEISLPELDLDRDEAYDYVWALVDSGAGANVARRDHFPNFSSVKAQKISLTIANGETMENNGAGEVMSYSGDGVMSKRVFYEAPVEMPILAVTELAQEGKLGSEVRFRAKDGCIIDNLTGRRAHFVKRKGVYSMRSYFPKNESDLTRQDP